MMTVNVKMLWIRILNQFYGHIKVAIYVYVILKYTLEQTSTLKRLQPILKLLSCILSPIVFTTVLFLKLVKLVISLWIAHTDPNYVSMLDGTESIFIGQETSENKAIVTTLFLLEENQLTTGQIDDQSLYHFCVERIAKIFEKNKFLKLQCSIQYKLGYFYFKKELRPIQSYFKEFQFRNDLLDLNKNMTIVGHKLASKDEGITMEELREYISEMSNEEMPQNGGICGSLWEARVGKERIKNTNLYPLVLRFHHIFGDATTLFNMFTVDFQTNQKSSASHSICNGIRSLDTIYTHDPFITMSGLVDKPDSNILCQTTGSKHILWHTEQTPKILATIKHIKTKYQSNLTTVDVLLTCLTESLANYLVEIERNHELPEKLYLVLPMLPPNSNKCQYGRVTSYEMSNQISLGFLRLPLKLGCNKNKTLLTRLEMVKKEYDVFKNRSLDYWFNRWQGTVVLTLLPWCLQKQLIARYGISVMVSNIPGCESLEFFGCLKVKEFIVIDPNISNSGVTVMITSYEKRLNIAYTIDRAVIPSIEGVRKVADGFMRNLHKLQQIT